MTLNDDEHEVARILREHEERLSDIEEASRSQTTPNLLVSIDDTSTVGDRVDAVTSQTVETMQWDDDSTGWDRGAWE